MIDIPFSHRLIFKSIRKGKIEEKYHGLIGRQVRLARNFFWISKNNPKKFHKPLDKLLIFCYNIIVRTKTKFLRIALWFRPARSTIIKPLIISKSGHFGLEVASKVVFGRKNSSCSFKLRRRVALKISTKWGAKCGIPNAQWRGTKG